MTCLQDRLEADQDLLLIERFRQGDDSAFDALFCRYKDRIYSLVYRTTGPEEAEDVLQEAFIRVYRSLGAFRGDAAFRTWLYRLTLNVCWDYIRRRRRRPDTCAEEQADLSSGLPLDRVVAATWERDELDRAVQILPQPERSAIELHYMQGLSYSEAADVLGCSVGTVKARVHSAMTKLRRRLVPLFKENSEDEMR